MTTYQMLQPHDVHKRARTAQSYGQLPPAGNVVAFSQGVVQQTGRSPRPQDHAERFRAFRALCRQNLKAQKSLGTTNKPTAGGGILEIRVAPKQKPNAQTHVQRMSSQTNMMDRRNRARTSQKRRRDEDEHELGTGPRQQHHPHMGSLRPSCSQAGSLSPSPQPGAGRLNSFSPMAGSVRHQIGQQLEWSGHACRIHSINPDGSYNLLLLRNNSLMKGVRLGPPAKPQGMMNMPMGNFAFAPR